MFNIDQPEFSVGDKVTLSNGESGVIDSIEEQEGFHGIRVDVGDGRVVGATPQGLKKRASAILTDEEVAKANSTARPWKDTTVHRYFREHEEELTTVLDYGAGKTPTHLNKLRDIGHDVTGWEIGNNFNPELHSQDALGYLYGAVLASNILNVQPSIPALRSTLDEILASIDEGGIAIMNYPKEPRYSDAKPSDIEGWIEDAGFNVERVSGTKSVPVWRVSKGGPHTKSAGPNRLKTLLAKYPDHWENIDALADIDPTGTNYKYLDWLVYEYINGRIDTGASQSTLDALSRRLKSFDDVQRFIGMSDKGKGEKKLDALWSKSRRLQKAIDNMDTGGRDYDLLTRDLDNTLKELHLLRDAGEFSDNIKDYKNNELDITRLVDAADAGRAYAATQFDRTKAKSEVVYSDDNWTVTKILNKEAAVVLGSGTNWCTANWYDKAYEYKYSRGSLYVFQNNRTGNKYIGFWKNGELDEFYNHLNRDAEEDMPTEVVSALGHELPESMSVYVVYDNSDKDQFLTSRKEWARSTDIMTVKDFIKENVELRGLGYTIAKRDVWREEPDVYMSDERVIKAEEAPPEKMLHWVAIDDAGKVVKFWSGFADYGDEEKAGLDIRSVWILVHLRDNAAAIQEEVDRVLSRERVDPWHDKSASVRRVVHIAGEPIICEVADTHVKQAQGLQGTPKLAQGEGMLFPYDKPKDVTFHMGSVPYPIDLIFVTKTASLEQETVDAWAEEVKQRLGLQIFDVWFTHYGDLKLQNLVVQKGDRKQGTGTAAMDELVDFADEHGLRVVLSPGTKDDYHGTTSRNRLVKFYKRFDFVENKGRNKDFALSQGMYREPFSKEGRDLPKKASCPIREKLYGGIPTSGGFGANKEYELAADTIAEAAHCILGALGKRIRGDVDKSEWKGMVRGERAHLTEEIGIIMKALGDYSRDIYTRQINDISQYKEEYRGMMREYNEKMVTSIRDAAPKLIDTARNNMSQLCSDMPKVVTDVATLTYQLLIVLSESLLKSLENWDETKQIPDHMNAYKDAGLQSIASELNSAISTMIQELS